MNLTETNPDLDLYDGWHLEARNPVYLSDFAQVLAWFYKNYFRVEAYGIENLPARGPALLIGNHSGGLVAADAAMTLFLWLQQRGPHLPGYALIDSTMFNVRGVNVHLAKCGGLRAHPRMAQRALECGSVVLLYPGGANDSYRPYSRRNDVELAGNRAFVKLALHYNIPIVPIVTTAHHTMMVIDDGKELAQTLGLDKQGIERLPVSLSMLGLSIGVNFELPFPVPFRIGIGMPIEFPVAGPRAAKDRALVAECFEVVRSQMQRLLDNLSP